MRPLPSRLVEPFQGARGLRTGAVTYLVAALAIPAAILARDALRGGLENFGSALTLPSAVAAMRLSVGGAAVVALLAVVLGAPTAHALCRLSFPGRRLLNALVDVPLAVPALAAGTALSVVVGPAGPLGGPFVGILWALLFVCLPLAVRTIQSALLAADAADEAPLPANLPWPQALLRRVFSAQALPGLIAAVPLCFSRALGEFGVLLLLAGNIPMRSQAASVYVLGEIECDNRLGAAAVSAALLLVSFLFSWAAAWVWDRFGRRRP